MRLPEPVLAATCLAWFSVATAAQDYPNDALSLRREYNGVCATIDTLAAGREANGLERLVAAHPVAAGWPAGWELVLVFWADDEAEVTLNGYQVARTRLTPIEVSVPLLYLEDQNRLQARCWDTDRVESGFMAGLYLQDESGARRPVLATEEGRWRTADGPAPEIYYTHSQPEIPGARVIWGERLFGEVTLEATFTAEEVRQAARGPSRSTAPTASPRPMAAHQVLGRLVALAARREELAQALGRLSGEPPEVVYAAGPGEGWVFTLGRAGILAEDRTVVLAEQAHRWAQTLPAAAKDLVLPQPRPLKGSGAATPPGAAVGVPGQADRRLDYQPPAERGPGGEAGRSGLPGSAGRGPLVLVGRASVSAALALAGLALLLYLIAATRLWWRLFREGPWSCRAG